MLKGRRRLVIINGTSPGTSWILIKKSQKIKCSKTFTFVTFLIIDWDRRGIYAHSYLYFRWDLFHIQRWRAAMFQRSLESGLVAKPGSPPFLLNIEVWQSSGKVHSVNSSKQFLKVCHCKRKRTMFQILLELFQLWVRLCLSFLQSNACSRHLYKV